MSSKENNRGIQFRCIACGEKHVLDSNQVRIGFNEINGEPEATANCRRCGSEMRVWL